ncbi:MAG: hypothetical protein HQK58_08285 [Deltaproteobacteria bacterium]|nr:hypothetical protein [Deltaproteobacteria bacterium]
MQRIRRMFLGLLVTITVTVAFVTAGTPQNFPANQQPGQVLGNRARLVATQGIYYEPTIKNIIAADCGRCHFGSVRYLGDYDNLKMYADSGMLATMVQGPMGRFAGNDADIILTWVDNGAPEKPGVTQAQFQACPPGSPGLGLGHNGPPVANSNGSAAKVTYSNTIKGILTQDCLQCHSGPFRNLTTYQNVKMYVDNGLLKLLVRRGGPMHRFAGPNARIIVDWIDAGAPQ